MKKNELRTFYIILLTFFVAMLPFSFCSAQQANNDVTKYQQAVSANIVRYKADISENLRLFNGIQYSFASKQSYGSPFFGVDSLTNGSICYDGNCYDEVLLKYDLVNQTVVIADFNHMAQIGLLNEKIQNFKVNNHQFVRLDAEKSNYKNITTGFYDKVYTGKTIVWVKRIKELKLSVNAEDQTGNFKEFDQYFIQVGHVFTIVTDKRELIAVLEDRKKEVEYFIINNKINMSSNIEVALIKVATYYDQLKN